VQPSANAEPVGRCIQDEGRFPNLTSDHPGEAGEHCSAVQKQSGPSKCEDQSGGSFTSGNGHDFGAYHRAYLSGLICRSVGIWDVVVFPMSVDHVHVQNKSRRVYRWGASMGQ
jgi:hypothetical protein